MAYLGIDIGTTGCKSALVAEDGKILSFAYEEYNYQNPQPGWAELDSIEVLNKTRINVQKTIAEYSEEPIAGISVSSLGEAVVPVTKDRRVLGPSILNFDCRGKEFLDNLKTSISEEEFYKITGNSARNHFTLTKLRWIKEHQRDLYKQADYFLPWTSFVSFMLGANPVVDFSLANRTLLFDVEKENWSDEVVKISGLDREKLPETKIAGTMIGEVSAQAAENFGLKPGIPIVIGAHDQCANAVGCGVIEDGMAMLGMGTFTCATPVYKNPRNHELMISLGANTEHHAIPEHFVSFIYNHGGSSVKWFRNTFAVKELQLAQKNSEDLYEMLFSEIPETPVKMIFLPYLSTTGLPDFNQNISGLFSGIRLDTSRGEILKGIIQGVIFDLKMTLDKLDQTDNTIINFRAAGGGSKSDKWVQMCANIFNCSMEIPRITESGVLGSAIIAGVGLGKIKDYASAAKEMVEIKKSFHPEEKKYKRYQELFDKFIELRNQTKEYLFDLAKM